MGDAFLHDCRIQLLGPSAYRNGIIETFEDLALVSINSDLKQALTKKVYQHAGKKYCENNNEESIRMTCGLL